MSRWKAFGVHLLLSAVVGAIALGVLMGLWYPPPYFDAAGGDELAMLLIGIDVTIGPLITLVIFKSGKPGLRFDLAVIACLQAAALAYGMHVMWVSRPVFLVAAVDRFTLVSANEIPEKELELAPREFRELSWTGPQMVGAVPPEGAEEKLAILLQAGSGVDVEQMPRYYVPFEQVRATLLQRGKPVSQLSARSEGAAALVAEWMEETRRRPDSLVYVPVVTRGESVSMLLDSETGEPLSALALDPW